jgi:hypothetical protein
MCNLFLGKEMQRECLEFVGLFQEWMMRYMGDLILGFLYNPLLCNVKLDALGAD